MITGFKNFILRGNILDLAVAVVIGTAFATLVSTVVSSLITPVLATVGSPEVGGLAVQLQEGNPASVLDFGAILNAAIVFLVTAAVVYVVIVVPMNKLASLRAAGAEPEPEAPTEDVLVLREIRDLLRAQQGRSPGEQRTQDS